MFLNNFVLSSFFDLVFVFLNNFILLSLFQFLCFLITLFFFLCFSFVFLNNFVRSSGFSFFWYFSTCGLWRFVMLFAPVNIFKSQHIVHKPQVLKRKVNRNGIKPGSHWLPDEHLTTEWNWLAALLCLFWPSEYFAPGACAWSQRKIKNKICFQTG